MNVFQMKRKDFENVPFRTSWDSSVTGFNSMVIVPTKHKHDSGYMCMDFVAVDDNNEPICRLSGCSDVIHINGIGGLGDWHVNGGVPKLMQPIPWSIDCLPCGLLRIFSKHNSLKAGHALSDFELYYIDTKKGE
ncbi:MAG: hypothetical protein J6U63_04890 [Clostridia bacterium]|nr:hypothetical protein [Clostridia bacterium]